MNFENLQKIKPRKKTETIVVNYWCCGASGEKHRHKTEASALSCMQGANRLAYRQRMVSVLDLVMEGYNYKQIGGFLEISPSRARSIFIQALRNLDSVAKKMGIDIPPESYRMKVSGVRKNKDQYHQAIDALADYWYVERINM